MIPKIDPNFSEKGITNSVRLWQLNMEEVFLRFPHLSETIFDLLDNKSLAKSKKVNKSWYFYLDSQKFLQTRIRKAKEDKLIKGQLILKCSFGVKVSTKKLKSL